MSKTGFGAAQLKAALSKVVTSTNITLNKIKNHFLPGARFTKVSLDKIYPKNSFSTLVYY